MKLKSTMKVISSGQIFAGKPKSKLAKTCFPFLCQLANGQILATFQTASVKNGIDCNVGLCRSSDGGLTWSEPVYPFPCDLCGKKGVVHYAYLSQISENTVAASILWCDHKDDASLEFFNPVTGGLLPTEIAISWSYDLGQNWSTLIRLEKGDLDHIPTPVMGPIQKLDNGVLLCPFETSKPYDDSGVWHHKAAYFISYDGGKSWPEYKVVAYDPQCRIYYWDHRLVYLGGRRLVDFFWAYDAVNHKELNAHMSASEDFGKTWSPPMPTEIIGQPWPIPIDQNRFAVVAVDRNISQAITLYLTDNRGKTFDAAEPLIIYRHPKADMSKDKLNEQLVEMSNWSYGLPTGICLHDGSILIAYYAGCGDTTDICWSKVAL